MLEKDSGEITHLLMHAGNMRDKSEVSIPASATDFCFSQVINLKLDNGAVKDQPPVSVIRSEGF